MGADRNARILQDPVVLLHRRVINRHAGVIDDLVHDTKGVRLRGPHEVVDRLRPVPLARGVDLVDRDHLSGFWLRREVFIMKPPPRGRVAAEALALVFGIGAGPRADVDDADLEDIAGLGSADVHGPGADVHAATLARAPPEQRRHQRRRHSADRERTLEEVPPSFAPPRVGLLIARTSRVLSLSDIGRHARFLPRVSTTPVASSAYRTIHGVSRRFKWDLRYGICDMERFSGPSHIS